MLNTSAAEEEITLLREELAQLRNEPRGSGVFLADLFGKMESGRFIDAPCMEYLLTLGPFLG